MENNKLVSKNKLNRSVFILVLFGAVFCFFGVCALIMEVCTDMSSTGLLAAAFFLLIGIGLLALGVHNQKKVKSAPTEEEVAQFKREEAERAKQLLTEPDIKKEGAVFSVKGARGRNLYVFDDKCIINVTAGIGSFVTGNVTDGEKTIYYTDVIGVQYKPSGVTLGYLQLETASSQMNNRADNHFNENSFTFDVSTVSNERMAEVADYVKKRVDDVKSRGSAQIVQQVSSNADELKKFKELYDSGVITEEEYEAKKKQLLGL